MVYRLRLLVFPTSLCHCLFKSVLIFFLSLIGKKLQCFVSWLLIFICVCAGWDSESWRRAWLRSRARWRTSGEKSSWMSALSYSSCMTTASTRSEDRGGGGGWDPYRSLTFMGNTTLLEHCKLRTGLPSKRGPPCCPPWYRR